jgi:hypothetical protein
MMEDFRAWCIESGREKEKHFFFFSKFLWAGNSPMVQQFQVKEKIDSFN